METSQRILAISKELFFKQGLKSVSMDLIAREIGISKRTLYEKYKDKDALIMDVLEQMFTSHKEMMEELIADHQEDSIVGLVLIFIKSREKHIGVCPAFYDNLKKYHHSIYSQSFMSKNEELTQLLSSIFFKCQEQGFFRQDLDLNFVLYFLKDVIDDKLGYLQKTNYTADHIQKYILEPYLIGICTEEGINTLKKYFKDDK